MDNEEFEHHMTLYLLVPVTLGLVVGACVTYLTWLCAY